MWPKMTLTPGQQTACSELAWVPCDVSFLNLHGMDGLFEQTCKLVGTLTIAGHPIALRAILLWDSPPEGRLGHIIQSAPKAKHYFLRNYLLNIWPLQCMIAETATAAVVDDMLQPCSSPGIWTTGR